MFEKGDYTYALFFGHLTVEKILKAIFTDKNNKTPPFSHNLVYLSEKASLELNDDNLELLEEVSDFNLEARYPDDKFSFYKNVLNGMSSDDIKRLKIRNKEKRLIAD